MSSKVLPLKNTNFIMGSKEKDKAIFSEEIWRIPEPIWSYMKKNPEFQWVFENEDTNREFVKLNPQFKPCNRIKYTIEEILKIPLFNRPVNGKNFTFDGMFGARRSH